MTEFELIERYFSRRVTDRQVLQGIGDDAAVLEIPADRRLVAAVDTIVEGVHFPTNTAPADIGYRALAVNLSDIAAMGAQPKWITLALSLPQSDTAWLESFATGLFELANRYDVALIGGDTVRGALVISVQILGLVETDGWLTRSNAKPGDIVFVSGILGEAAAGLAVIQREINTSSDAATYLKQRFLRPEPRIELGRKLRMHASAVLDVSDGLLADLGQLCRASGCGAHIDIEALPASTAMRKLFSTQEGEQFALAGGDDYELLFTVSPDSILKTEALIAQGVRCTPIGRLTEGSEVQCCRGGVPMQITKRGYVHFA